MTTFKVNSSHEVNGQEICNTCVRPISDPYRYRLDDGSKRGCIASCHDRFVRFSTDADWVTKKRYRLPKWIAAARAKMPNFERCIA